jgi:hypothetical protein
MQCICGCGRDVPESKFACPEGWSRLQEKQSGLAARIIATYRTQPATAIEHLLALGDGRAWFRRDKAKTPSRKKEPWS